jgi:hypothetical protein
MWVGPWLARPRGSPYDTLRGALAEPISRQLPAPYGGQGAGPFQSSTVASGDLARSRLALHSLGLSPGFGGQVSCASDPFGGAGLGRPPASFGLPAGLAQEPFGASGLGSTVLGGPFGRQLGLGAGS